MIAFVWKNWKLIAVGLFFLGILGAVGYAYLAGGWAADEKNESDQMKVTIENTETFNEATTKPDGCNWFERLYEDCAD